MNKIITIAVSGLCLIGLTNTALARHHHHESSSFSFSVGTPPAPQPPTIVTQTVVMQEPDKHHGMKWVRAKEGRPLPTNMVIGGQQSNPNFTLFVCRANYNGGLHPGKLIAGRCNIGWGGNEISLSHYEVLVAKRPMAWIAAANGYVPPKAVIGGYQQNQQLAVCQAQYNGGTHPGKVVANMCNFGWGGREITIPYYNVLVRS